MQDFASSMVVKSSSPLSSMVRNFSDQSLSDIGDDKCFTLTKVLGYHVIYGMYSKLEDFTATMFIRHFFS